MAMSQSERIRLLMESSNKFVSRSKVRDSSELTLMNQAKAAKGKVAVSSVAGVIDRADCPTNVTFNGNGTNKERLGITLGAQGCAVCSDPDVSAAPYIILPTVCPNPNRPPYAQQDLSGAYIYKTPCTDPGKRDYFPAPLYDGSNCNSNRQVYSSG